MKDLISQIKNYSIVDVISNYIKLKKANSKQYKGCCPFHKENTPSFFVDTEGYYKCFGCNKGGDVINFVQEIERIDFKQAVDKICSLLKIEAPRIENKISYLRENSLLTINEEVVNFFQNQLFLEKNKEILNYLINIRKINLFSIKLFKIGFCDEDEFLKFIKVKNFKKEDLIQLSLIKKTTFGEKVFFQNRIIIPILNKKGQVISFAGRIYKNSENKFDNIKYLNGSTNIFFNKSTTLFNINNINKKNKNEIIAYKEDFKIKPLIIVEGYLDVITLNKFNIDALASMGTSLSEEQINLIFSINKTPYFCYDNDNAGKMATFNICKKILNIIKTGICPKFIFLHNAKDADEFLNKFTIEDLNKCILNAKEFHEYIFDYFVARYDIKNPNQKSIFEKEIEALFNEIQDKNLAKNYIFFSKNKVYSLLKSKTKKENVLFLSKKNINIYIKKLTLFLFANPEFKQHEELFKILKSDNQDLDIIANIINDRISITDLNFQNEIKNEFISIENKEEVFIAILNGIKMHNLSLKKDSNNLKNKIIRKSILDNKLNSCNKD